MTVGIALPDLELPASGGGQFRTAELKGRRTVLYFYPKDNTPGCTLEAHQFTALISEFNAAGVDVYGVSRDSPKSHDSFLEKCAIGYPLVSDPDAALCDALGVRVHKSMMGKTFLGIERSTFVIGPDGTVEREWRAVKPDGHAAEVLAAMQARSL